MNTWFKVLPLLAITLSVQASYQQVFVPVENKTELSELVQLLGGVDHCGSSITTAGVELPVTDATFAQLVHRGYSPEILIADLEKFYSERMNSSRNYGDYHTYSEGIAAIQQLHDDFPSIVGAPQVIGQSMQGNDLYAIKISDNPGVDEDEPEVFYNSYTHAREAITIEVLLHFMNHLTDNYASDPRVTAIVNNRELWFVPIMNPDGVLYNESTNPSGGGMWRKTRRDNGDGTWGVDPNRNWGHMWGYDNSGSSNYGGDETYRGPSAFSEPCTQVVREFVNAHDFASAITYHSYSNLYIYPYGYDEVYTPEPHHSAYVMMTDVMNDHNGYACGTGWELLYPVNGDTDDWFHGGTDEHDLIMAITPEVGGYSDGFWPSESRIPALVAENLEPNMIFAEMAGNPWSFAAPVTPALADPGVVDADFTLTWSTASPDENNLAVNYDLVELSGYELGSDSFDDESNWDAGAQAFTLSNVRSNSAPTSYFGGYGNVMTTISTLSSAVDVQAGTEVSFYTYYDIESDWDYAYLELSTNGSSWTGLEGNITTTSNPNGNNDGHGITGSSTDWDLAIFDLSAYAGQSVQLRLRYETDGSVLGEGIYIDDFSPVYTFGTQTPVATAISEESYAITGHAAGTTFYRVRARDAEGDLSAWSSLLELVCTGAGGGPDLQPVALQVVVSSPNVVLWWDPVPDALSYRVFYSENPWSGFEQIAHTPIAFYMHENAASLYNGYYRVVSDSEHP
jgi:hypothetical protein